MEIVIDIEDYDREWIANGYHIPDEINSKIAEAIIDGTPLPEHHGRLIDGDKVLDEIEKQYPASVSETDKRKRYARLVYYWAVKNAPTIIEADKGVLEKINEKQDSLRATCKAWDEAISRDGYVD